MLFVMACSCVVLAGSQRDLAWLRSQCPNGAALVYQYGGSDYKTSSDIYLVEVSTGNSFKVGKGSQPEFSPDASKLVWVDGTTAKGRMRNQGDTSTHVIATGVASNAGVHWMDDDAVVVVKGSAWYRVTLSGTETAVPQLTSLGLGGTEIDVKYRGSNQWSYVTGTTWKTSEGASGSTGGHCSPSLSPDGRSVTGLQDGHDACNLTQIISGGVSGTLSRTLSDCSSKGFDNHRWSSNAGFVVAQYECDNRIGVWKVGTSDVVLMGDCTGESYGDFTVGSGAGAAWPGSTTPPSMVCDEDQLAFAHVQGESAPSAQTVDVYTSSGTLEGVTKNSAPSWLTVSLSATSGSRITVTNTVNVSGVAAGAYTHTVTVSSSNAGSISYDVRLDVTSQAAQPALRVTYPNGGEAFTVGQAITVTWAANEDSINRVEIFLSPDEGETWYSITPNGSVNAGEAGWEAYQWTVAGGTFLADRVLLKIEDYNEGSGIVDESDGPFAIREPGALHLKYNCGASKLSVTGWDDPSPFASGGTDFDFGTAFSVSGVANAAPADVYRTCRHRISGSETGFAFTFASVPDGWYTVRMHFGDGNSTRAIDVSVEGQQVVSDLNISGEVGAYTALVIERTVQVSDGNGLTLAVDDDRSSPADVFINGIEIIAGSAPVAGRPERAAAQIPAVHVVVEPGRIVVAPGAAAARGTVVLRDLAGRVALSCPTVNGATVLNTSSVSTGFYHLSVTTGDRQVVYPVSICR